jgi:DNA-directed RNA polymerase specialized sigma24 family protein
MVMKWERIEPWDYIVVSVASEYSKKFRMVELGDIKQTLYHWFMEHPNKLTEWEALGERESKNLIYRSLRNEALDYCQRWKAKTLGYEHDDLFYYDPAIIEVLLPSVIKKELITPQKLNPDGPKQPSAPAEGGNLVTMMIEVDIAYLKLSDEERELLYLRFADASDYSDIAVRLGIESPDAVRMRIKRAVRKLVNKMGGYRPYLDEDSAHPESSESSSVDECDNTIDGERGKEDITEDSNQDTPFH